MAEAEAEVLKVGGDYLVIVVYFVFVLLVGLLVSLGCSKQSILNLLICRHHGDQRGTVLEATSRSMHWILVRDHLCN